MRIEILGPGCPKCDKLAEATRQAVAGLDVEAEVLKVTDIVEIANRGVLMTPALVVDGQVKSSGKVLTPAQIRDLLG
ncbi:MAG: thioredoxin family protein [Planctomycetota bacterium]|jgi:small redox-active disulfide protein 2